MKSGFIWDKKDWNPLFYPVVLLLAVIPFVIRATQHFLGREYYRIYSNNVKTEIFSQYRARFLWIVAAVMLVLLVAFGQKLLSRVDRLDWLYFGFSGVFLLFLVLSTVFSAYPDTAMWGLYSRAEGMVTQIGYIVLFLYAALTYRSTRDLKLLMVAVGIFIAVNAVTGISQALKHDLLLSDWVNQLVVPEEIGGRIASPNGSRMYGVANHYNYIGSVTAVTLPLCTVLALFEKNWKFRIPAILAAVFSLMLLIGSSSRAGLVGVSASVVFGVVFFRRWLLRHWKAILLIFGILLAALVGLNAKLGNNALLKRIPSLMADIRTMFSDTSDFDYKDQLPVRGVENREDGVVIFLQEDQLHLSMQKGEIVFHDQNGEEVLYTENDNGVLETSNNVFSMFSFELHDVFNGRESYTYLKLVYNKRQLFQFYYDENQIYLTQYNTTKKWSLQEPPIAGFLKGKEHVGSDRVYIWSRTIPLLPKYLLTGAGPDCFILEFPQDDVLGKLYAFNTITMVVDKPHNLYLQIFVNEGGIALLAFLAICIMYFWDCFRLYGGKEQKGPESRGIAVALGVAGYLFAGFFNDSTVLTAVLFWAMLGVGVGMNRQYRKERKNQE